MKEIKLLYLIIFNYVKNDDRKLILVDDKGNKVNENEF